MSIIVAILVFSLLVIVHEWGHYIAAIKCGVNVEEFSIGMGPAIFQKKGKNVLFSIRILPIGGYCKMTGEDEASNDEKAFCNMNVWKKMLIVAAGGLMNILYAIVLLIFVANFVYVSTSKLKQVYESSPAMEAGLLEGDEIIGINNKKYKLPEDIKFDIALNYNENEQVDLLVKRDNKEIVVPVKYIPVIEVTDAKKESDILKKGTYITKINGKKIREIEDIKEELKSDKVFASIYGDENEYALNENEIDIIRDNRGNKTNYLGITFARKKLNAFQALGYGLQKTGYYVSTTYRGLKLMITGKISGDQISGPVGIIKMIGDTYNDDIKSGVFVTILELLSFSAMLSINLGVINLLPLPALDGGRFAILLVEVFRKKAMDIEKEAMIHTVGFALLMILMVVILYNDVAKIFGF